jgi:Asp-tRNA(Asn)/Glu-tRNA(Gln) amidotransferase A subunit family amidase
LALLEAQGAEIVEVSAPHFEYGVAAYYLILPAEASSNLAKFDSVRFGMRVEVPGGTVEDVMAATRDAGFGDEVKRRIILGTYALSAGYYDAYYGSAQKVRTSSSATSTRLSPTSTSSPRRRLRPPPSSWARRSTTRCRCTSTTSPRFR